MIMENVPNIMKARTNTREPVIDIVHLELEKLGYNVYSAILEAI